jgi:hypothetical protein
MERIYSICRHICAGCDILPVGFVTPGGGIFAIRMQCIVEPASAYAYNAAFFLGQSSFEFPEKSQIKPTPHGH